MGLIQPLSRQDATYQSPYGLRPSQGRLVVAAMAAVSVVVASIVVGGLSVWQDVWLVAFTLAVSLGLMPGTVRNRLTIDAEGVTVTWSRGRSMSQWTFASGEISGFEVRSWLKRPRLLVRLRLRRPARFVWVRLTDGRAVRVTALQRRRGQRSVGVRIRLGDSGRWTPLARADGEPFEWNQESDAALVAELTNRLRRATGSGFVTKKSWVSATRHDVRQLLRGLGT